MAYFDLDELSQLAEDVFEAGYTTLIGALTGVGSGLGSVNELGRRMIDDSDGDHVIDVIHEWHKDADEAVAWMAKVRAKAAELDVDIAEIDPSAAISSWSSMADGLNGAAGAFGSIDYGGYGAGVQNAIASHAAGIGYAMLTFSSNQAAAEANSTQKLEAYATQWSTMIGGVIDLFPAGRLFGAAGAAVFRTIESAAISATSALIAKELGDLGGALPVIGVAIQFASMMASIGTSQDDNNARLSLANARSAYDHCLKEMDWLSKPVPGGETKPTKLAYALRGGYGMNVRMEGTVARRGAVIGQIFEALITGRFMTGGTGNAYSEDEFKRAGPGTQDDGAARAHQMYDLRFGYTEEVQEKRQELALLYAGFNSMIDGNTELKTFDLIEGGRTRAAIAISLATLAFSAGLANPRELYSIAYKLCAESDPESMIGMLDNLYYAAPLAAGLTPDYQHGQMRAAMVPGALAQAAYDYANRLNRPG